MTDILDTIQAHIDSRDNPHHVTKIDLGLSNVQNFPVATLEEAFAGTAEERYVTPAILKRVFDGILTRRRLLNTLGQPIPL